MILVLDGAGVKLQVSGKSHWLKPLALLCCLVNAVSALPYGKFSYTDNGTYITIIGYPTTDVGAVEIPATIFSKPVKSIGDYAFKGCSSLTSVTIPSGVTSIGNAAFQGCSSLTSVVIPVGVTSIGYQEFLDCSSLTSVVIPSSVRDIGRMAFKGCSSLTSVTIPSGVTSIGDYAFQSCWRLTSMTIPDSVISIGEFAFANCWRMNSLKISNSMTSIPYQTFSGCSSLTSVTIPNSISFIGDSAFQYCTALISVIIPASVSSISNYAFSFCTALSKVTFLSNEPALGAHVFLGANSGFTVYYLSGKTGFTTPVWYGYPAFPGGPPQITSVVPPAARAGTPYTHTCTATGTPTPAFTTISGALPDGLSISSAGVISGTPTVRGVFTGEIKATNGFSPDASQNFTIDTNEYHTLIAGGSHGTVTGGGVYLLSATANISATANPGYVFTTWSGDSTGNTNPLPLLMDSDKTIGATFAPDLNDDDQDGLTNWQEIVIFGTTPGVIDSDGDGLTDAKEVNLYGTNPTLQDSDGDGFLDGAEVEFYSNPLLLNSVPEFIAHTVLDRSAGTLQFRFLSQPGKFYTLEASTDLVGWEPLESGIAGTGGTLSRNYPLSAATARWFRAKVE